MNIKPWLAAILVFFNFLLFNTAFAQGDFNRYYGIPASENSTALNRAWEGGLNNPMFSNADFDNDGIMDLVVFDKSTNHITTYLNQGGSATATYVFAPNEANVFSDSITDWILFKDYNCDGIQDYFTYAILYGGGGVSVFTGNRDGNGKLFYTVKRGKLWNDTLTNPSTVYCSSVDLPAIEDIDGDGDLDILSFPLFASAPRYFKNKSVEQGFGCDNLIYEIETNCWGGFTESSSTNGITLGVVCKGGNSSAGGGGNGQHAGSSMTLFDNDSDGDYELLLGDISYSNIYYLENGGSAANATITSTDSLFPSYSTSYLEDVYPGCSVLDVDNDGDDDILAAPLSTTEGTARDNIYYYQNNPSAGVSSFTLTQNDFLVGEMIDLGIGAYPTFIDFDGDGDLDIISGNQGSYNTPPSIPVIVAHQFYKSSLALIENTGSNIAPSYNLTNRDWQGLRSMDMLNLAPTFGDLDADGDIDLMLGESEGRLIYLENTSSSATVFTFASPQMPYSTIDVGRTSTPQLIDMDADNDLDLVIGDNQGGVQYFENTGTATNPTFSSTGILWDSVDTRSPFPNNPSIGNAAPHITPLTATGELYLLLGSANGHVELLSNVESNVSTGQFNILDQSYTDGSYAKNTSVAVADIVGADGIYEMLIGMKSGGFALLSQDTSIVYSINDKTQRIKNLNVYPNPAESLISFSLPNAAKGDNVLVEIIGIDGNLVYSKEVSYKNSDISADIGSLPNAMYLVRATSKNIIAVGKVIKSSN